MNAATNEPQFQPGQRVKCWGIVGGPFLGRIKKRGDSKDCWIVLVRGNERGSRLEQLHEDYLRARP